MKGRTALERRGALVLQAKQCHNCHSLDGIGGKRGPALDSVAVRLTQDQLIRQVIQGGGNMPAYGKNLSPAETTALVAFLETLHPAGQAPARNASRESDSTQVRRGRFQVIQKWQLNPTIACAAQSSDVTPALMPALADYWALTKPEVNFLIAHHDLRRLLFGLSDSIVITSRSALLAHTLLGTLLVASGAGTLNQFVERRFDAQMRRTARRPIPAGRLEPAAALRFGIFLSLAGAIYLAVAVNVLASLPGRPDLGYLLVPLYAAQTRRTPLCTLVGALPGAMPPLIGWAAASGNLAWQAWILYALLFLWQFPHFMAIAWMYREDYARAGYLVLPHGERRGRVMAWQSALPAMVLVVMSSISMLRNQPGLVCPISALALSASFFSSQHDWRLLKRTRPRAD